MSIKRQEDLFLPVSTQFKAPTFERALLSALNQVLLINWL